MPVIGLFIEGQYGYGSRILAGIEAFTHSRPDWTVELLDMPVDALAEMMRKWRGDGAIATVYGTAFKRAARAARFPVINVTGVLDDAENVVTTLRSDDYAMGEAAAAYLIERGFSQMVTVWREGRAAERRRAEGFVAGCARHGIVARSVSFPTETKLGSYVEQAGRAIASWPAASAIFATEDRFGMAFICACRAAGRAVPDDLAVIGAGNDAIACELSNPSLSSVDGDLHRRGFEAAALLDELMTQRPSPAPKSVRLIPPIGVITRESTNAFAMTDREVVQALIYIREHLGDKIDIEAIAGAARLSRRSLELRLRRARGRSVQEEIWHQRVLESKSLLRRQERSVTEVAYACGFSNPSTFSIIFHRETGMTPSAYRTASLGYAAGVTRR